MWADISYDVRETTTAHPALGLKSKETVAHVMFQGKRMAIRQDDMVQVVDAESNLITLIDYRTKTFATSNLDEVQREDDKGFDSIQAGIRSELVQSGAPAEWKGLAVKRDVARNTLTGGDAPGEIVVTSDWLEDVPGLQDSLAAMRPADERHTQEIYAELQTLVFEHPERFGDGLKVRKSALGRNGFQVHSLSQMRLAADAPMLKAIGPEYASRPILSEETEVVNLNAEPVDPGVFLVPDGFEQVEFMELLRQKYSRRHF